MPPRQRRPTRLRQGMPVRSALRFFFTHTHSFTICSAITRTTIHASIRPSPPSQTASGSVQTAYATQVRLSVVHRRPYRRRHRRARRRRLYVLLGSSSSSTTTLRMRTTTRMVMVMRMVSLMRTTTTMTLGGNVRRRRSAEQVRSVVILQLPNIWR